MLSIIDVTENDDFNNLPFKSDFSKIGDIGDV